MPEIYNPEREMNKVKRGIDVAKDGSHVTPKEARELREESLKSGVKKQE